MASKKLREKLQQWKEGKKFKQSEDNPSSVNVTPIARNTFKTCKCIEVFSIQNSNPFFAYSAI